MVTASIIAIGSELMRGKMDDTNSTFLARWFEEHGIKVMYRLNVEDTLEAIEKGIASCSDVDIVVSTGGLGPTADDLTREAFARYIGCGLYFNEDVWGEIARFLDARNYPLSESNKQQAFVFDGGHVISNTLGTAPGLYYKKGKTHFFLLPGPPSENRKMVTEELLNILTAEQLIKGKIFATVYRLYDVGESMIADLYGGKDDGSLEIGYYFSQNGFVELHFRKYSETGEKPADYDAKVAYYRSILDENKIFYTEDKALSELLYEKLATAHMKATFAESCTGGRIAAEFVKNPGVSAVFNGGVVTYSNQAKGKVLSVKEETLAKYGAVSRQTVEEMAQGVLALYDADIAGAVSGIAGPDGGTDDKPVGLVWLSVYYKGRYFSEAPVFTGGRERVINRSVNRMYRRMIEMIDGII